MKRIRFPVLWLFLCFILLSGCSNSNQVAQEMPNQPIQNEQESDAVNINENEIVTDSIFNLYFICVVIFLFIITKTLIAKLILIHA